MAFLFLGSQKKLRVLGIMNGTSLDGADFVLVEIDRFDLQCQFKKFKSFSFSLALRSRLQAAAAHDMKVDQLALLHHELGRYYAACFKKLNFGVIDLIGLHGQTVFHQGKVASLQIGEPSYLAEAANVAVVSDFRVADIAVGGQGAPIATFFHQHVFGGIDKKLSVHNLGGISNLTLLKNGKVIQGFDTGPANMLMDLEIQRATRGRKKFDSGGKLARSGNANIKLVQRMLKHPYFKKSAPKSCGREEFGIQFLQKFQSELSKLNLGDRLASITEFVAESISLAYQNHATFIPNEIVFCGGGVLNKFLIERIQIKLLEVKISIVSDYDWPSKSIEGAAFALLAAAKVLNKPSNLPQSTGASKNVSLGKLTYLLKGL